LAIVLLIIELALLTEYFAFPKVKAVLQEKYEMKPKMLSDVEVEMIGGSVEEDVSKNRESSGLDKCDCTYKPNRLQYS